MAIYFHGIVTCRDRKTAAVQLTSAEHEQLLANKLPCPCCGQRCAPTFSMVSSQEPFVIWNGDSWGSVSVLEER